MTLPFDLQRDPFSSSIENEFFFKDSSRNQHLNMLLHLTQYSELLLLVTGVAGIGKTSLIRKFVSIGDESWRVIMVNASDVFDPDGLLKHITTRFGIESVAGNRESLLVTLKNHLINLRKSGLTAVFIIDDAHQLPEPTLELILKLSEMSHEDEKLIKMILSSEPMMEDILTSPAIQTLRQSATHTLEIPPFSEEETTNYILHRLKTAGLYDLFTPAQIKKIYKASLGIPARINKEARESLVNFFSEQDGGVPAQKAPRQRVVAIISLAAILGIGSTVAMFMLGDAVDTLAPDNVALNEDKEPQYTVRAITEVPETNNKNEALVNKNTTNADQAASDHAEPDIKKTATARSSRTRAKPGINDPETGQLPVVGTGKANDNQLPVVGTRQADKIGRLDNDTTGKPDKILNADKKIAEGKNGQLTVGAITRPVDTDKPDPAKNKTASVSTLVDASDAKPVKSITKKAEQVPVIELSQPTEAFDQKQGPTKSTEPPPVKSVAKITTPTRTKVKKPENVKGTSWLSAQNRKHYTIQMGGGSNKNAIMKFIKANKLQDKAAIIPTRNNNGDWYLLIYGSYPGFSVAKKTIKQFSTRLKKSKPWVREFSRVQALAIQQKTTVAAGTKEKTKNIQPAAGTPASNAIRREPWLKAQNPAYYTIMLVGSSNEATLMKYIDTHKLRGKASYFYTHRDHNAWYVLLYDIFPDREHAIAARDQLPEPLRKGKPWVRTLASVHEDIDKARPLTSE